MTELDAIVRACLAAQVHTPPLMDSPADQAITGARTFQRRRAIAAACVVAVLLALGGLAKLREGLPTGTGVHPGETTTLSPSTRPHPDLLTASSRGDSRWDNIVTADGRTIPLAGVTDRVDGAYQTTDGWLVLASVDPDVNTVWLVKPDGSTHRLISRAEGVALGPDGRRFAWRDHDRIHVGHLTGTAVVEDASTPAPQRGEPIAYTGSAVVLGYSATGGGIDHHDVWIPSRGDYVPSWDKTTAVILVYPPTYDGSLFGLVQSSYGSKDTCLAELDPAADLAAIHTACGLPVTISTALVSPDGRWLATGMLDNGQSRLGLIDLGTVFATPKVTGTYDATGPVTWVDSTTFVVDNGGGNPLTAHVGMPGVVPIVGPADTPFQVVRHLP